MDAVVSLHGKGGEDPCCVDIVAHTIRSRATDDGQVIVSKGSMVSGSCMSNKWWLWCSAATAIAISPPPAAPRVPAALRGVRAAPRAIGDHDARACKFAPLIQHMQRILATRILELGSYSVLVASVLDL